MKNRSVATAVGGQCGGAVLFMVLMQTSAYGQAPIANSNQPQQVQNSADTPKADQRGTSSQPLILKPAPKDDTETAEEQHEKDRKELLDRRTFYLGFAVAIAALLQVVGLVFQILLFSRQTKIMDGSLVAARDAADAAKQAIVESRDTAKKQLRAYVCVSKAILTLSKNGMYQTHIHLQNAGQTPAHNVTSWSHPFIAQYPPHPSLLQPPPSGLPRGIGIIPPGGEQIMPAKAIEKPLGFAPFNTGKTAYIVHGRLDYSDIFNDNHFVEYRLIFGGPMSTVTQTDSNGVESAMLVMDTEGNQAD